jgi:glucose/arabinose dehydrogenase
MWFSDNGRDLLGDDIPSDELNVVTAQGQNFGYPYCHQGDLIDPEIGEGHSCEGTVPPALKVGPHVASIGVTFYTGSMFPASYRNALFIAQHGSWNRTKPIGYRVMVAHVDGQKVTSYEPFVDGFLPGVRVGVDGQHTGDPAMARPVDVQMLADGSLLISDDSGGRIFRVTYGQ